MEELLPYIRDYGVWGMIGVFVAWQLFRPESDDGKKMGWVWKLLEAHVHFLKTIESTQQVQVASTAGIAELLSQCHAKLDEMSHESTATESQWRNVVSLSVEGLDLAAEKCGWPPEVKTLLQRVRESIPQKAKAR